MCGSYSVLRQKIEKFAIKYFRRQFFFFFFKIHIIRFHVCKPLWVMIERCGESSCSRLGRAFGELEVIIDQAVRRLGNKSHRLAEN